ncbi:hypothetical protein E4U53_000963 [Claviceps sorghi]|nr:hypothetical protein E4U53_000963 [Claviceps sorghi]
MSAAVRFLPNKHGSPALGFVQLQLRVKTGASKPRQGILAVTTNAVELCVAAQPRQGEANGAVVQVLSHVLAVPRRRVRIVSGFKSRDKIATIDCEEADGSAYADAILNVLHKAASHATSPPHG